MTKKTTKSKKKTVKKSQQKATQNVKVIEVKESHTDKLHKKLLEINANIDQLQANLNFLIGQKKLVEDLLKDV